MSEKISLLDKLTALLETEEGQRYLEEFGKKLEQEEDYRDRQVERFKQYTEGRLDEVLEKIIDKYDSDEYVRREYRLGYEPRETLLWVAFNYAEEYCKPCEDPQYANTFTGSMYTIGSYVIQVMHGQGSVVKIEKIN
jgi:hypothetical protein